MANLELRNKDVIYSSIIQSAFKYLDELLSDFKKLQPEFKYSFQFGTNLNQAFSEENDTFNIVMFTGGVDKIPTFFIELNGVSELLYAGYFDVALSIINPIPLLYDNNGVITTIEETELTDNLYEQSIENNFSNYRELVEENSKKIEYATRLLEGLSLYLTRRGIIVDNFEFSTRADLPMPDGQFEVGRYRLTETLPISFKFKLSNSLGNALKSGEQYRCWIKTKSENNNTEYQTEWTEIYSLLDFTINNTAVDKSFPLYNQSTVQNIPNQINRVCSINCPELDIGGCELIKNLTYSGNLDALNNIKVKYNDGVKDRYFTATYNMDSRPASIDQFNGWSLVLNITSNITEQEV